MNFSFIFAAVLFAASTLEDVAGATALRQPRILNGTQISAQTAPYQVSIRFKYIEKAKGYGAGVICGGAVISQRMVISGAYCIMNYESETVQTLNVDDLTVVMGSPYLNISDKNTLQYNVQELVPHPKFQLSSPLYDIGAIFINGFIPWNWPTVSAIALNQKATAAGTNCTVTGYGNTTINRDVLVSVTVPIMSNQSCSAGMLVIAEEMFCAGLSNFSGVDACNGDAGDPLVCNGLLTGVASSENGCIAETFPGYYVNVSDVHEWIVNTNASFNYSHYAGGAMGVHHQQSHGFICLAVLLLLIGLNGNLRN